MFNGGIHVALYLCLIVEKGTKSNRKLTSENHPRRDCSSLCKVTVVSLATTGALEISSIKDKYLPAFRNFTSNVIASFRDILLSFPGLNYLYTSTGR